MDNASTEETPPLPLSARDAAPLYLFNFPRLHVESDKDALSTSPRAATMTSHETSSPCSSPQSLPTPRPQASGASGTRPFLVSGKDREVQKRLSGPQDEEVPCTAPHSVSLRTFSSPSPRALPLSAASSAPPTERPPACPYTQLPTDDQDAPLEEWTQRARPLPSYSSLTLSPSTAEAYAGVPAPAPLRLSELNESTVDFCGPQASLDSPPFAVGRSASRHSSQSATTRAHKMNPRDTAAGPVDTHTATPTEAPSGSAVSDRGEEAQYGAYLTTTLTSLSLGETHLLDTADIGRVADPRGSLAYALPARDRACGAGPPSLAITHFDRSSATDPRSAAAAEALGGAWDAATVNTEGDTVLQATTPDASAGTTMSPKRLHSQRLTSPTLRSSPLPEGVQATPHDPSLEAEQRDADRHVAARAVTAATASEGPQDLPAHKAGIEKSSGTRGNVGVAPVSTHLSPMPDDVDPSASRHAACTPCVGGTPSEDHSFSNDRSVGALSNLVMDSLVTLADFPARSLTSPSGKGGPARSPISPTAAGGAGAASTSSTCISAFAQGYLAHLVGFTGWQGVGWALATPTETHTLFPSRQGQRPTPPPRHLSPRPQSLSRSSPPPPALSHNTTAVPVPHASPLASPTSSSLAVRASELQVAMPSRTTPVSGRTALVLVSQRTSPHFAALPSPRGTSDGHGGDAHAHKTPLPQPTRAQRARTQVSRQILMPSEASAMAATKTNTAATPATTTGVAAHLNLVSFKRTSPNRGAPAEALSVRRTPADKRLEWPSMSSVDRTKTLVDSTYNDARRPFASQDWSLHSRSLPVSTPQDPRQRKNSSSGCPEECPLYEHGSRSPMPPAAAQQSRNGGAEMVKAIRAVATHTSPGYTSPSSALRLPHRRSQPQALLSSVSLSRSPSLLSLFHPSDASSFVDSLHAPTPPHPHQWRQRTSFSMSTPHSETGVFPHDGVRRETAEPPPRVQCEEDNTLCEMLKALHCHTEHHSPCAASHNNNTPSCVDKADEDSEQASGARVHQYAISSMTLGTSAEAPSTSFGPFPTALSSLVDAPSSPSGMRPS